MRDPYQKVRTGDPLRPSAEAWNAMLDVARAHKRAGGANRDTGTALGAVSPLVEVWNRYASIELAAGSAVWILPEVKTTVGSDWGYLPSVVKCDANGSASVGASNLGGSPSPRLVIVAEPIGLNGIGVAYCGGMAPCYIDVRDVQHEYANLENQIAVSGTPLNLTSDWDGSAYILWKATASTGVQKALVMLNQTPGRMLTFAAASKWVEDTSSAAAYKKHYVDANVRIENTSAGYSLFSTNTQRVILPARCGMSPNIEQYDIFYGQRLPDYMNIYPALTGAYVATTGYLDAAIGTIVATAGSAPRNWYLCDGTHSTPNLTGSALPGTIWIQRQA